MSLLLPILVVVPVAADPDEPPDGEPDLVLTDEQREKLRKSMDILSRAISPIDFKFQSLVSPAFTKLVADMGKLPAFTLPESVLKNFTANSAMADAARLAAGNAIKPILESAAMTAAFKPLIDQQALRAKQYSVINSDLFMTAALAQQSTISSIAAQLTKSVDFGMGGAFAKVAQQIAAQQSSWLKDLGPNLAGLKASFYPPNLRDMGDLRFEEVEQVVMVDGIALYAVPRKTITERLVRAEGASKRREILGRRWRAIASDCRDSVAACTAETVAPYVSVIVAALDALEAGHVEAAQALTGSLLDSIVNSYFGKDRYLYTPDKRGKRTNAAYEEFGAHEYIAFAPVWQAWQKFFPDEGLPVPHTFSRNATVHTVSPKQYNRRNAIQGLMIVSGILVFLDEQAARLERQRTK